jgi:hypothetical protein
VPGGEDAGTPVIVGAATGRRFDVLPYSNTTFLSILVGVAGPTYYAVRQSAIERSVPPANVVTLTWPSPL